MDGKSCSPPHTPGERDSITIVAVFGVVSVMVSVTMVFVLATTKKMLLRFAMVIVMVRITMTMMIALMMVMLVMLLWLLMMIVRRMVLNP